IARPRLEQADRIGEIAVCIHDYLKKSRVVETEQIELKERRINVYRDLAGKDVARLTDHRSQDRIVVNPIPCANSRIAAARSPGDANVRSEVVAVRLVDLCAAVKNLSVGVNRTAKPQRATFVIEARRSRCGQIGHP